MISKTELRLKKAFNDGYRVISGKLVNINDLFIPTVSVGTTDGYERFTYQLIKGNKNSRGPVHLHRLVALEKYGNKMFTDDINIRHKNNNKLNNKEDNILIGSRSDNMLDKPKKVRQAVSIKAATKLRKFTDEEMKVIKYFYSKTRSYKLTMEEFNITSKGTLHYIINTKYQTKI